MDSESSCTYRELADDYESTNDSTMWHPHFVTRSYLNDHLGMESIPIVLHDQEQSKAMYHPATLEMSRLDEMVIEPLLSMPTELKSTLNRITGCTGKELYVSASTYGIKNLLFSLLGCLLCTNGQEFKFYIPRRLMNKVVRDCREKGIDCTFPSSHRSTTYYAIDVPSVLVRVCELIFSASYVKSVRSMLTPVHNDGYIQYCIVQLTVCMFLQPGQKTKDILSDGNMLVRKEKRCVHILPLYAEGETNLGNVVAWNTTE